MRGWHSQRSQLFTQGRPHAAVRTREGLQIQDSWNLSLPKQETFKILLPNATQISFSPFTRLPTRPLGVPAIQRMGRMILEGASPVLIGRKGLRTSEQGRGMTLPLR